MVLLDGVLLGGFLVHALGVRIDRRRVPKESAKRDHVRSVEHEGRRSACTQKRSGKSSRFSRLIHACALLACMCMADGHVGSMVAAWWRRHRRVNSVGVVFTCAASDGMSERRQQDDGGAD